jgi:hypothetical protein
MRVEVPVALQPRRPASTGVSYLHFWWLYATAWPYGIRPFLLPCNFIMWAFGEVELGQGWIIIFIRGLNVAIWRRLQDGEPQEKNSVVKKLGTYSTLRLDLLENVIMTLFIIKADAMFWILIGVFVVLRRALNRFWSMFHSIFCSHL